jgi:hypothetical protein
VVVMVVAGAAVTVVVGAGAVVGVTGAGAAVLVVVAEIAPAVACRSSESPPHAPAITRPAADRAARRRRAR